MTACTTTMVSVATGCWIASSLAMWPPRRGEIAGLEALCIVNEPIDRLKKNNIRTIMVLDRDGETFGVLVLEVGDGARGALSTNGDTHLGGEDFDETMVDWLEEGF